MKVDLICVGNSPEFQRLFAKGSSSGLSKVVRMLATVLEIAAAKLSCHTRNGNKQQLHR